MYINTSSSLSVVLPFVSSSNSLNSSVNIKCQDSTVSKVIYTIYTAMNILLLFPVFIFILCMGFQRWHQHSAHAGTAMSNFNFFTYNMMIVESFAVFESVIYTLGTYTNSIITMRIGILLFSILFPVEILFHVMTCVERYLAVVYPITYMHLRESHGIRIRNISAVCAWLQSIGWLGVICLFWPQFPDTLLLSYLGVCMVVIVFCCLSVLHVLNLPGPGNVGRNKEQVDQSKQRAFHMIMVITGFLLLKFAGLIISFVIEKFSLIDPKDMCMVFESTVWLGVPSRLVLPLLFLHKAGKLSCGSNKTDSG